MPTIELTKDNFEATIAGTDTVIVDFWAEWCGPCKMFGPTFEAAADKHPDIVFAKVDTEAEQELAGYFNIRSIPTLMVFREKVVLYSQAGALPGPMLDSLIERYGRRFLEKIYTAAEIDEGLALRRCAPYFAARFAAREAFFKALGTGWGRGVPLRDASVAREPSGRPVLVLRGRAAEAAGTRGVTAAHLSLAHEGDAAQAFVVLEGEDK